MIARAVLRKHVERKTLATAQTAYMTLRGTEKGGKLKRSHPYCYEVVDGTIVASEDFMVFLVGILIGRGKFFVQMPWLKGEYDGWEEG